jgi:hypothetical protein
MDLAHPSPKEFALASIAATVVAWVPWASAQAIFAETTWPDVGRDLVGILGLIVTGYFAYLAKRNAGEAKVEAREAKVETQAVNEKVGTFNTDARAARETAIQAAKVAVKVAAESEKKHDRRDEKLDIIANHTNGEFAALKRERDELRKFKEQVLLEQTPPTVAQKLEHIERAVEEVLETSKSGTKLPRVVARDPNTRERADDPKGE